MFDYLKNRAEAAQSEYERDFAGLFRDDEQTQKLYADEEHQERILSIDQARSRKLDGVIEELKSSVEGARTDLAVLEDGDPTALVSTDELSVAATKMPFATADVQSVPRNQLVGKLRAVLNGGNRATVFAYWRAASDHQESIRAELRGGGGSRSALYGEVATEDISEMLERMRVFLAGPERLAKAETARTKLEAATEVEMLASSLKVGARSPGEVYMNRRYGRLPARIN